MASVIHTGNATMSNTNANREPGTVWTALTILLGAGAIYLALSLLVGYAAQGTHFGSATAQVWQSLVSAQGVIWAAALWLNFPDVTKAFETRRLHALGYATGVLLALAMPTVAPRVFQRAVFALPQFDLMGPHLSIFMRCFVAAGSIVAALIASVVGVSFVDLRRTEPNYQGLMDIRRRLQRGTTTLSTILVAAIAATSWLQRSLEVVHVGAYPKEIVLSYGLYFTALLLVVYLPATAEFYRAAAWLVDAKYPMPEFDPGLAEKRAALLKELGITKSDALQAALATLSPIVGAVLSMTVGKG